MTTQDTKGKGPGQGDRGHRGGFSFGDKEGDRRRRRDGRDRKGGGVSYRVVIELSALEKALTKLDFAAMKAPLEEVLRTLKPAHLKLEDLDLETRGKLITSLMRVVRAPRPKSSEAEPTAGAAPADNAAPADSVAPAENAAHADSAASESHPVASSPASQSAPAAAAPAVVPATAAWREALFLVGLIWRAMAEVERAAVAFELAGRQPTENELALPPRAAKDARDDNGLRTERGPRLGRRDRQRAHGPIVSSGDWQQDAQRLEELGRTRDAGRIHEKHQSYGAAARLFEMGGDLKAALRNAALGKLDEAFTALCAKLKPEDVVDVLQRAQAWEKLMEFHVARNDFAEVARLYERAKQFDQAALAWERAGKLSLARKAYERAKDGAAAARVRDLEVQKLVARGDRLGAATLLVGAGMKAEALEVLKPLPGPKAYHFMVKLKLRDEARALAQAELEKATAANDLVQKARWLEVTGALREAAETFLAADRKVNAAHLFESLGDLGRAAALFEAAGHLDKAQALFEKAGDTVNAERVKAVPRPEPRPKAASESAALGREEKSLAQAMPPPQGVDSSSPGSPLATA
jgi:tetratricopeptide (TPR) repeat protein